MTQIYQQYSSPIFNDIKFNESNTQTTKVNLETQPDTFVSAKKDKKDTAKKVAIGAGIAAGIIAVAAIIKNKKFPKSVKLQDIKFDKGIANTVDGNKFTGVVKDTLKSGDKVTLEYVDGVIKHSKVSGSRNFEKTFETNEAGHKIVKTIKNGAEKVIDITQKQADVLADQTKLDKLLKDATLSSKELSKQASEINFKSKNQQKQIENIVENKKAAEQKAKIEAEKVAQEKAKIEAEKLAQEKAKAEAEKAAQESAEVFIENVKNTQDLTSADAYLSEYKTPENKAQALENLKGHEPLFEDEYELLEKYQNCTYEDLDKLLGDGGGKDIDKIWFCATGNLNKKGSSVLVDEIPDMFKGIPEDTLTKSIDNLTLCGSDGTYKIGDKIFDVKQIGGGTYSRVYKISDGVNKPVALKMGLAANDTAYCNEILLSRQLKKNGIVDIPKFYMGNPIREDNVNYSDWNLSTRPAWQMLDFISENQKVPEGKKLFDYLKEIGGNHFDFNSGTMVGDYIVDLGGIRGNGLPGGVSFFVLQHANSFTNGISVEEYLNAIPRK